MPSPTYSQNKTHIYKWREKHADTHRAQNKKDFKKQYYWRKIQKQFLNILIDGL
jgi:hypothetical protein